MPMGQQLVEGHGLQTEELGGLTAGERIVAVPQQRGQLDPAPDVHSAETMGLSLVQTWPLLTHVLEHPLSRDAQFRH